MAKKLPKNNGATKVVETEEVENKKSEVVSNKPEVAAVNVDTDNVAAKKDKKDKANKKAKNNKEKKPNIFQRFGKWCKSVISELKKVTWPKGKTVLKSSLVVLTVVIIFFVVLFIIDYVLAGLFNLVINGEWATIFIGK